MKSQNAIKSVARPPVVVVMGHIDHGKSKLLDFIRQTNIVDQEAGGITQHTSAYEVQHETSEGVKKITFLDTPGHEAFTKMRSRGALVADIAILVVSAEDGVKSQTLDALNAIKEVGIPYIVAINKIDKPNADVEKTKMTLMEHGIYLEGSGGDVPWVAISAKRGDNIDELLDVLILASEMAELTAELGALAEGYVIESNVDPKKGISATLIIKSGTLKRGMCVVAENACAPVRICEDFKGDTISEATVSAPIRIVGWDNVPRVGSSFQTFEKKKDAETCAAKFIPSDQSIQDEEGVADSDETIIIPVVLKADVSGTLEALKREIKKCELDTVKLKLVSAGVGAISENDIRLLSGAKDPVIIGFNTTADSRALTLTDQAGMQVHTFSIIYKLTEWLEDVVTKRAPKKESREITAHIKVLKIFSQQKNTYVLGGHVNDGTLTKGTDLLVIRRSEELGVAKAVELQSQKLKADKITEGNDFGAKIESNVEIHESDELQAFTLLTN